MENILIIAVVLVIVGLAAGYVVNAKKSGRKCIGCPGNCSHSECASCSCHHQE